MKCVTHSIHYFRSSESLPFLQSKYLGRISQVQRENPERTLAGVKDAFFIFIQALPDLYIQFYLPRTAILLLFLLPFLSEINFLIT